VRYPYPYGSRIDGCALLFPLRNVTPWPALRILQRLTNEKRHQTRSVLPRTSRNNSFRTVRRAPISRPSTESCNAQAAKPRSRAMNCPNNQRLPTPVCRFSAFLPFAFFHLTDLQPEYPVSAMLYSGHGDILPGPATAKLAQFFRIGMPATLRFAKTQVRFVFSAARLSTAPRHPTKSVLLHTPIHPAPI
jgi:hypothetical protein